MYSYIYIYAHILLDVCLMAQFSACLTQLHSAWGVDNLLTLQVTNLDHLGALHEGAGRFGYEEDHPILVNKWWI